MTWIYGFKCITCGKTFEVLAGAIKDSSRSFMYCSTACYRAEPKSGGYVTCETCKRDFFVNSARIKQSARNGTAIRFCSMTCYIKTGDKNPFWGHQHKRETVVKLLNHPNRFKFPSGKNNPNYKRWEYRPSRRTNPAAARRNLRFTFGKCEECGWDIEPLHGG
jgi:hypothetical protein